MLLDYNNRHCAVRAFSLYPDYHFPDCGIHLPGRGKRRDHRGFFMLLFIAIAVYLFVTSSGEEEIYKILLQEKKRKAEKRKNTSLIPSNSTAKTISLILSVYWPLVTCFYFVWSFFIGSWSTSWLIWILASVVRNVPQLRPEGSGTGKKERKEGSVACASLPLLQRHFRIDFMPPIYRLPLCRRFFYNKFLDSHESGRYPHIFKADYRVAIGIDIKFVFSSTVLNPSIAGTSSSSCLPIPQ